MTPSPLSIRPVETCRFDVAALGEVMLRFDPGEGRVRNARSFQVWEGGGEYNVARALAKGFGLRATVLTALPRNDLGRLADDLIAQGGVNRDQIVWRDFDGIGRNTRVGLNFTERGFGLRPALGVSDRANSAASQMRPDDIDWDDVFGVQGVRWLHTGGIFAALSESAADTAIAAVEAARRHGVIVSYDLNYRASLWNSHPDPQAARRVNRRIVESADVVIGDSHGFLACLDFPTPAGPVGQGGLDSAPFQRLVEAAAPAFPNLRVMATTLREVTSANRNDWSAILWADGRFHEAAARRDLEIFDRVGGGDGFAAGLIWAFLSARDPRTAIDVGAAHGTLAMTTPGDASMTDLAEVEALLSGAGARVIR